MVSSINSQQTN